MYKNNVSLRSSYATTRQVSNASLQMVEEANRYLAR